MPNSNINSLNLRLKSSKLFSTVAIILLFDSIAALLTQKFGLAGSYFDLVLIAARISIYFILFFAFKTENEAEFIAFEKKNGLLKALQVSSILLLLISIFFLFVTLILNTALANEKNAEILRLGEPRVYQIKYLIDLLGNIFSNINLVALFSVKIYLDENKDNVLRTISLANSTIIFLHLLSAIAKYIIKYFAVNKIILDMKENTAIVFSNYIEANIGNAFFNIFTNLLVYASYFAILFLFEYRNKSLKNEIITLQNNVEV